MNIRNAKLKTGDLKASWKLQHLLSSFQFQVFRCCEAPVWGFFVMGALSYES
jgi:hypothetical protein